ncbi:MAG TPA: tetratricopeptide repeat protein, partial [Steroidobacteraceae bacterium]|nr:tetratricopeptide repeat protein [Steroidobacteraceae bacterium]
TDATLGTMLQPDSTPPPNSIAVLPFLNLTGDPGNDYLGEGLAEELMIRLAKSRDLRVAARRSAFAYKGRQADVRRIAEALGVNYVVEGSVRRHGGTVRVNAALVERATGENRWVNAYERSSDDFFSIEQDIGTQIITALELVLEPRAAHAAAAGGQDAAAYDRYLRGLARLRQPRSTESLAAAEELFEQALAAQPGLARAQAGLCETRVERFQLERLPAHVAAAEEACSRAEALDSSAQEVQMAIGRLRLATGDAADAVTAFRRAQALAAHSPDVMIGLADALAAAREFQEAEKEYRRAIATQPSYAAAHMAYGDFLFSPARAAEAAEAYEHATILTPADPMAFSNLGASRLLMGDFQGAADAFERSLALDPRGYAYANMGSVEYYLGRYREAETMYRKAAELAPDDHRPRGNLADAQLYGGRAEDAAQTYRRALELVSGELAVNPKHSVNQAQAAYYASRLGEADLARRYLADALAGGDDDHYVHYYAALTELGFGNARAAIAHINRSRELGYPEILLKNAPELGDIRSRI